MREKERRREKNGVKKPMRNHCKAECSHIPLVPRDGRVVHNVAARQLGQGSAGKGYAEPSLRSHRSGTVLRCTITSMCQDMKIRGASMTARVRVRS